MEQLRQLLMEDNSDIIYDSGFATPITRVIMEDISAIVKASHHCLTSESRARPDCRGSQTLWNLFQEHPSLMQTLLDHDPAAAQLTVDQIVKLFEIFYSPEESTKRVEEEAMFMHWNEFLNDLANGVIGKHIPDLHYLYDHA